VGRRQADGGVEGDCELGPAGADGTPGERGLASRTGGALGSEGLGIMLRGRNVHLKPVVADYLARGDSAPAAGRGR
jgi:hypothetical protein